MLISELASLTGVKVSTVRFYERRGLLPDPRRSEDGYRRYGEAHARRVRFLRRGQELGFALGELAAVVAFSDEARAGTRPEVREQGRAKLVELDRRIADLRRMRGALESVLDAWVLDPEDPCPIEDSLAQTRTPHA
ncbi:MerR family transcriptional regulator [Myceligenerans indicum]|uniref:MerR family DNA-binding transcriptional regulator n=1 Tax=Myceligenerans indicum TaxID=2593663 RepID=A0ABS1LRE7_9MICO|nr:MerR family transcriptional regulator [Myceligenerans indicum]MBL0888809.1 MerR family DNA-binding transcriptional regulator [Myceligenerans indicum]